MNPLLFWSFACLFSLLFAIPQPMQEKASPPDLTRATIPYDSLLLSIRKSRSALQQDYLGASGEAGRDSVLSRAASCLHQVLANELFPYWYGTPWDFNGISEVPGQGQIACGYFISTTLKHAGFRLNRYRMAQSDATTIIRTLCGTPYTFRHKDSVRVWLGQQPDGLFVLGLDFHVVYVDKQGGKLAVVHSSYLEPVAVVREPWEEASVLDASRIFVVGKLSSHRQLLKDWLLGNRVWPE